MIKFNFQLLKLSIDFKVFLNILNHVVCALFCHKQFGVLSKIHDFTLLLLSFYKFTC